MNETPGSDNTTPQKTETPSNLPAYEPPRLTLMNEDEVLSAFQVPVVATSWWIM
jgi:hypothetical protein